MSYAAISSYLDTLIASSKIKTGGVSLYDIRIAENVIDPAAVKTYSHGKRMGLQIADAIASVSLIVVHVCNGIDYLGLSS